MEKLFSLFSTSTGSAGRSSSAPAATVSDIFVYPIKSCRGISVHQAPITSTGFRWDRQWMVVNSNGRAFTQRVEPKLALVEPELPPGAFDFNWESSDSSYMVLRAPDMDPLKVCLNRECNVLDGISVWEWSGTAFDEGDEASEWFTKYLGKPSRLVRFNTPSESRFVDPDYAQGYTAMFSDGYPYLVISQVGLLVFLKLQPIYLSKKSFSPLVQGSLDFLNELLKEPLPINRFRPNILVDGCAPFSEDLWKVTKLNNIAFHGVKLCARCKVPTINQESGTGGTEPTETLMKFRTDKALKRGKINKAKVYFGMNFVCAESLSAATLKEKVVKIGDPIHVLQSYASPADAAA